MASNRTQFHVVPYNDSWQIKRNGLPVFEFPTKSDAVDKAAAEARLAHPAQVVIHTSDGQIEEEHTYDSDPVPPKG
jgi:hypothetical protein